MGKKLITYTLVIYSDLCLLVLAVLHLITNIINVSNRNDTDSHSHHTYIYIYTR